VTGITAFDSAACHPRTEPEEVSMGQSEKKRVLIVDNDEEESRKLEGMLQQAGYESSTTWSGLEALELLRARRYDVLLVSTYLPDLYVGDFCERLRRLPTQPCTILMQEDHDSASMVQNVRCMIGERKTSDTMKAAGCDPK